MAQELVINIKKDEFLEYQAKCDKYDYLIAVSCGALAGLIDIFFVGDPLSSILGKKVDGLADDFVKKAAQLLWKNDKRTSSKCKNNPQTLEQCISYLEQAFPVNYDARFAKDLIVEEGILSGMRPLNHHLLSLAHSPDPIGLIFSIIDQFTGYATFVDKGKIIHVIPRKTSNAVPYLQGTNLPSMLFCGFANWIGHILSDLVGSSSTRKIGKTGRGAGIPMPFFELFLLCNFGDFDGKTLAETMVSVFENGYDARFCATMMVPVLFEELTIRTIWAVKRKFYHKRSWKECVPDNSHPELRLMLIVGNGTLCILDGVDAAIRSGGNWVNFFLRINMVAWFNLLKMVLKEIFLRLNATSEEINRGLDYINAALAEYLAKLQKIDIEQFEMEMKQISAFNDKLESVGNDHGFVSCLYDLVDNYDIDLPFNNHGEFDSFMRNDDSELIL